MNIRQLALFVVISLPSQAFAAGSVSHIYFSREAVHHVTHSELVTLLHSKDAALVVGSAYPDTGYLPGTTYGEDSHWDPFIFAFADDLKERYVDPVAERPDLVAFLMGCASHRVSDEIFHWRLVDEIAANDFDGNWEAAHHYADLDLDMMLISDKKLWFSAPKSWRVPVSDLLRVYDRMGLQVRRKEIIVGNVAMSLAGLGERFAAPFRAKKARKKAPWAAANYLDSQECGYAQIVTATALYWDNLFAYLKDSSPQARRPAIPRYSRHNAPGVSTYAQTPIFARIKRLSRVQDSTQQPPIVDHEDGSIEVLEPEVTDQVALQALFETEMNQD